MKPTRIPIEWLNNLISQSTKNTRIFSAAITVLLVGSIGTYIVVQTRAATCMDYAYSQSGTTNAAGGSGSAPVCINYIQKIINGEYEASASFASYASKQYGFGAYLTDNGVFDAATTTAVKAAQSYFANLTVSGSVNSSTWIALCGMGLNLPNPDSAHYWELVAKGAAQHSGCTNQSSPPLSGGTTPTPAPSPTPPPPPVTGSGNVPPLFLGLDAYAHWDKLSYLEFGDRVASQTAADPNGSNTVFNNHGTIFDELGPGVATSLRMQEGYGSPWTMTVDGKAYPFSSSTLGQTNPSNSTAKLFPYPLSLNTNQTHGSSYIATAIPFTNELKIVSGSSYNGNL